MVTKLLFTLAVIALVVALVRLRRRPAAPRPVPVARPRSPWVRVVALATLGVMLVGSAVMVYLSWRDAHQLLQVRVVDAGTGRVTTYRVQRNQLHEHGFVTIDGRQVRLAQTERMEILAAP